MNGESEGIFTTKLFMPLMVTRSVLILMGYVFQSEVTHRLGIHWFLLKIELYARTGSTKRVEWMGLTETPAQTWMYHHPLELYKTAFSWGLLADDAPTMDTAVQCLYSRSLMSGRDRETGENWGQWGTGGASTLRQALWSKCDKRPFLAPKVTKPPWKDTGPIKRGALGELRWGPLDVCTQNVGQGWKSLPENLMSVILKTTIQV